LTATATLEIQNDIARFLSISLPTGLLALPIERDNLNISVTVVDNEDLRRSNIIDLVKKNTAMDISSVGSKRRIDEDVNVSISAHTKLIDAKFPQTIVYVWRRDEADSLGELIKSSGIPTVVYHAGLDTEQKERAQAMFDSGAARCIVATVAFGVNIQFFIYEFLI
jgi:superfamily II DNA helicase RecQ